MSNLVLDSLEIKNFRAFKHLRIEKLGRVNLIVGKNNIGKTSLLEALTLYACRGDAYMVFALLHERNEAASTKSKHFRRGTADAQETATSLRYLFHGRGDPKTNLDAIEISTVNSGSDRLSISVKWPSPLQHSLQNGEIGEISDAELEAINNINNLVPRLHVEALDTVFYDFPLNQNYSSRLIQLVQGLPLIHGIFVAAGGLELDEMAALWDNVALSELEKDVLNALRVIAPEILAVNLVGGEGSNGERIPKVRIPDFGNPLPLRSMGEGMNRMFGIALALVNAKDGLLLIDEVDTGLHYSVLPDLWRLIFEVAHRLNVQVFVTSHSWDCIQAFQQAADENIEEEGMLVRLEHRNGEVSPVMFDERKLNIAAREQIEVR